MRVQMRSTSDRAVIAAIATAWVITACGSTEPTANSTATDRVLEALEQRRVEVPLEEPADLIAIDVVEADDLPVLDLYFEDRTVALCFGPSDSCTAAVSGEVLAERPSSVGADVPDGADGEAGVVTVIAVPIERPRVAPVDPIAWSTVALTDAEPAWLREMG